MTRIYVDTNIILDFYQSSTDDVSVFETLSSSPHLIVLCEQTVNEARRNRESILRKLIDDVKRSMALRPHTTSIVRSLAEFKDLIDARKPVEAAATALLARLEALISAPSTDKVWTAFEKLVNSKQVLMVPTSDALIEKAHRRKLLGEPPISPGKHSIGDELVWESLLAGCGDDLIIVSRDATFRDHESLLKTEYARRTPHTLFRVSPELSPALAELGAPSKSVEEQEKHIPEPKSDWCERCGGAMEEYGFEGSDGDEFGWLECSRCGHIR